jgi:hypothetical protein
MAGTCPLMRAINSSYKLHQDSGGIKSLVGINCIVSIALVHQLDCYRCSAQPCESLGLSERDVDLVLV